MCGIWGIFGSDEDLQTYFQKAYSIRHRGPDAFTLTNIEKFTNCLLCFHRLAITDSSGLGNQPMMIKDFPHIITMCNGELYNYKKLRDQYNFNFTSDCDCEILIHLYAYGGIDFMVKMLDGVYAFCVVDTQAKKVYIGRDTIGVRPMYRSYQEQRGFLAFSSEAKGIVDLNCLKTEITPLLPGLYEEYDVGLDGKASFVERKRFHSIEKLPKWADTSCPMPTGDDHAANIRLLFTEAVRKRFMSKRRIGCFLSGGLDSSLVSALAAKFAKENGVKYALQTFSVGLEGSTDVAAARKVAAHIGSEHHEIVITPEEGTGIIEDVIYSLESYDIITLRGSIAMYLVAKYIKEKTDTVVVYSGEGSDELFQGYINFHLASSPEEADEESRRLLNDLYLFDVQRSDKIPAAHGLEIRVPFLDHHLISYVLSIPQQERGPRFGIEKYLLRKAFDGTRLLPDEILWRPKEGFSEGVSSTKKSWNVVLKEFVEDKVTESMMKEAPSLFPFNTPTTKEAFYYRQIFERRFGNHSSWIPYMWWPKWTNMVDPSARGMKHYKKSVHNCDDANSS
ncbi:asparagine synthetase [glutamine-hydrolyzing]-like [Antedon mediterranea]|uniref:asparagine synthetase [glutamine-hydrolyzing]-like n=1 Tax=Antedon mediterranea TaxID=105859 RepID=UPI003AF89371